MKELIDTIVLTLTVMNLLSAIYALHWVRKLLQLYKEEEKSNE